MLSDTDLTLLTALLGLALGATFALYADERPNARFWITIAGAAFALLAILQVAES